MLGPRVGVRALLPLTPLQLIPILCGKVDKAEIQNLSEEARVKLFDKARASVLSDYLLARLKLVDG